LRIGLTILASEVGFRQRVGVVDTWAPAKSAYRYEPPAARLNAKPEMRAESTRST